MTFRIAALILLAAGLSGMLGCTHSPRLPVLTHADSTSIIQDNLDHRTEVDKFFREDPNSPFIRDTSVKFTGIQWYPVNVMYRGQSALHRYQHADTVTVMGTKGEARRQLRYGYFEFPIPDYAGRPVAIRLNVYKFTPYDGQRYLLYRNVLSLWFTDSTTGKDTYDVGRYVEVGEELSDESHVYTIDLNKAYNPYCAYSDMYSCAVPREEDRLPVAIRAGERKYPRNEHSSSSSHDRP